MDADLAYAAGLYEGEGSCVVNKCTRTLSTGERKDYPIARLTIAMTDLEPLERFQEALGMGVIYGPYAKGAHKPVYHCHIEGLEKVRQAAYRMMPWLSSRRKDQIMKVLEYDYNIEPSPKGPRPKVKA